MKTIKNFNDTEASFYYSHLKAASKHCRMLFHLDQ